MIDWLIQRLTRRPPDFVIGGVDSPYLRRWWLIPRNRFFSIYLHEILRDDDDRALHDHPWWNCSILLRGRYIEIQPLTHPLAPGKRSFRREPFRPVFRTARQAHRLCLELDTETHRLRPCWSLFIRGPVIREWGFWCPQGWRRWQDFVANGDKGAVGKGCAE